MKYIKVRNVSVALADGFWHMKTLGPKHMTTSRNGPVLVSPGPVLTEYEYPMERVLFDSRRDANPVFHLMETIWMLSGSQKVNWLVQFNSQFGQYAEADGTVWGAYGHRWRSHFGMDQIEHVIAHLGANPNSRRAVIGMWSPEWDLGANVKDVPCNTTIYFNIVNGALEMTVCCRSNDMLWGAYGANAVHMSFLQELIATALEVEMGPYRQFSNNFHLYTDVPMVKEFMMVPPYEDCSRQPYDSEVRWLPMLAPGERWQDFIRDCEDFVLGALGFRCYFMNEIASPLRHAYLQRKNDGTMAVEFNHHQNDWVVAFHEWCARRDSKKGQA